MGSRGRSIGAIALLTMIVGCGSVRPQPTHAERAGIRPTAGHWQTQTSSVTVRLTAVAFPTARTCFATGDGGTIIGTTDGGATWRAQTSGTAFNLPGIACTDARTCYAVGIAGTIVTTTDGGATWINHTQHVGNLAAISCPRARTCYVTGSFAALKTVDGGQTWSSMMGAQAPPLYGISCPSVAVCYAVGPVHVIMKTSDGGATWAEQNNPLGQLSYNTFLNGVSCLSTSACVVVGQYGSLLTTADGGGTWVLQAHQARGPYESLDSVACLADGTCYVAGTGGVRLFAGSGAGQRVWSSQTSTQYLNGLACMSDACYAVGTGGLVVALSGSRSDQQVAPLTIRTVALYHMVSGIYRSTSTVRVGEAVLYVVYYRGGSGVPTGAVRFIRNGTPSSAVSLRAERAADGAPDLSALLAFPRTAPLGAYTVEFSITLGQTRLSRVAPFTLHS